MTTSSGSGLSITRYRGDTNPEEFKLQNSSGSAVDISGRSFVLAVNPVPNPVDDTNDIYSLTASITDASNGLYRFPLNASQSEAPAGKYFFDIRMTYDPGTGSVTKIIASGTWSILQGIN